MNDVPNINKNLGQPSGQTSKIQESEGVRGRGVNFDELPGNYLCLWPFFLLLPKQKRFFLFWRFSTFVLDYFDFLGTTGRSQETMVQLSVRIAQIANRSMQFYLCDTMFGLRPDSCR